MIARLCLAFALFCAPIGAAIAANPVDAQLFSNISASTAAFTLHGGYYLISAIATFGGGSVELQALGPDQSTWLSLPTALKITANGTIAGYLPPGQYRFTVTTATAVYASVAGVPIE
jgi:hypothetical protein